MATRRSRSCGTTRTTGTSTAACCPAPADDPARQVRRQHSRSDRLNLRLRTGPAPFRGSGAPSRPERSARDAVGLGHRHEVGPVVGEHEARRRSPAAPRRGTRAGSRRVTRYRAPSCSAVSGLVEPNRMHTTDPPADSPESVSTGRVDERRADAALHVAPLVADVGLRRRVDREPRRLRRRGAGADPAVEVAERGAARRSDSARRSPAPGSRGASACGADLELVGVGGAGDLPPPEAGAVALAGRVGAEDAEDVGLGLHHDDRRPAVGPDLGRLRR